MLILQSLKRLAGQSCISCWWNSPLRVFKHTSLRSIQRDFTLHLLTRAWKETLCHGALVQFSRWRRSASSQNKRMIKSVSMPKDTSRTSFYVAFTYTLSIFSLVPWADEQITAQMPLLAFQRPLQTLHLSVEELRHLITSLWSSFKK